MMIRLLFLLFVTEGLLAGDLDPLKISKANKAKEEAKIAFNSKKYDLAIQKYKFLIDTLNVKDDKALLNLAHSYMRKADYAQAKEIYSTSTTATNPSIRSIAYQQLGILASENGNKEEALVFFKNAIKNDPSNDQARFNYELLLKNKNKEMPKSQDKDQRDQEEKKNQDQQKKDQKEENKSNQNKKDENKKENQKGENQKDQSKNGHKEDNKGKEGTKEDQKKDDKGKPGEEKEESGQKGKELEENQKKDQQQGKGKENKPSEQGNKKGESEKPSGKGEGKENKETESISVNKEQLKNMNMTEQQARALLNSMRQAEIQYIQQMKRTPGKGNEKQKKDW